MFAKAAPTQLYAYQLHALHESSGIAGSKPHATALLLVTPCKIDIEFVDLFGDCLQTPRVAARLAKNHGAQSW
jgi:hypothetical protein